MTAPPVGVTMPGTATVPGKAIMQYVMTHDPGNTIKSQRRRFYASISHGVKWIDYFQLQTYATGGGDFCDGYNGMYPAVLKEIREYGMFSDIVADGVPQAQGAKAAIVFSQTSDIYLDDFGTGAAAKRALYIAIRHAQIALDVVIEEVRHNHIMNLSYTSSCYSKSRWKIVLALR
jgi:hypothetical protein